MKKLFFVSILLISTQLFGQTKRDPRVVGLSGAYTTIAEGIFCVGYNPALVTRAHDKPFMLQLYQSDRGFLGNFFSIENVAQFSGDTLNTKENDELFGSIKPKELTKTIKETNDIEIKPSQIDLNKEINKIGEYEAKINLHAEIQAKIHIQVVKIKDEN